MFYAWSNACKQMSSQLCMICTIWNIKYFFPSRSEHTLHNLEHQRLLSIKIFDVLRIFLQVFWEGRLFTRPHGTCPSNTLLCCSNGVLTCLDSDFSAALCTPFPPTTWFFSSAFLLLFVLSPTGIFFSYSSLVLASILGSKRGGISHVPRHHHSQ